MRSTIFLRLTKDGQVNVTSYADVRNQVQVIP